MPNSLAGWLAFAVLAATIGVASCQAWRGPAEARAAIEAPA